MKKLLVIAFLLAGLFSTAEAAPPGTPFIAIVEPAPYVYNQQVHFVYGNLPNNLNDDCTTYSNGTKSKCVYIEVLCQNQTLFWLDEKLARGNVFTLGGTSQAMTWTGGVADCRGILKTVNGQIQPVFLAEVSFHVNQ